jgi:hypothetical protein
MKPVTRHARVLLACTLWCLAPLLPVATAQTTPAAPAAPAPPNPTKADTPPGLASFLLTLGMGGLLLLANAFPTKRSHQD